MTSIKDAIKLWEQAEGKVATEATDIRLCPIALQHPLIQKMDGTLGTLKKCKHLRLSTNSIDKITALGGMDSLHTLSMGRNQLKKIEGLEVCAMCPAAALVPMQSPSWSSHGAGGLLPGAPSAHSRAQLIAAPPRRSPSPIRSSSCGSRTTRSRRSRASRNART